MSTDGQQDLFAQLDPIVVASMRHRGMHDPQSTSGTWEELILWASPRRLLGRRMDVRGIGMLWDDPRQWPADQRRYDVGIPIDPEDSGDIEEPAFLNLVQPGRYLKAVHQGSYDTIMRTYETVLEVTLRIHEYELVSAPIIELYRNSPSEIAEEELVTDIYFPVIQL
jgi:DNA gyrase inhibitor GyrI